MADKDLLEELEESGMDPGIIERIRAWNDASPIRKQAKSATKQAEELAAENATLRKTVMATTFEKVGLTVNPDYLNLPADLAIHDPEAVRTWAQTAGFISTSPSETPENLAAHDRMTDTANGAPPPQNGLVTPETLSTWSTERIMRFKQDHPREFESLKRGEEVSGISISGN